MILAWNQSNLHHIAKHLMGGSVAVIPTDTLYGTLALATNELAVEKVYALKGRKPSKPCIILISSLADLSLFGIKTTEVQSQKLNSFWPGPVSVVLDCHDNRFAYLHRGTNSLAFRLPDNTLLGDLLRLTGPLIAPSANPEGLDPALDIPTAIKYFGDQIPLYVDTGKKDSPPSTLVSLQNDQLKVLRGKLLD